MRFSNRETDITNVMDYGAVASSHTDNTFAFQNAINASCNKFKYIYNKADTESNISESGGDVFIPQGKYGIIGPINWTCPVYLHGGGEGTTTLVWIGNGSNTLLNMKAPLTDDNRYWYNGGVERLNIVMEGKQTGAAIKISQCNGCVINRITSHGLYRAVVVFAGASNTIENFNFRQMHGQINTGNVSGIETFSTGIEWYGSDNGGAAKCDPNNNGNCKTRSDVLSIFNGHVDSMVNSTVEAADCIYAHDFAATMWVKNMTCEQTRNGLNVRCDNSVALGNCPEFIQLDRFEVESNNVSGHNNNHGITADNFAFMTCFDCQLFSSQRGDNIIYLNNTRFHSGHFEWHGGKIQNANGACVLSQIDGTQWFGGVITQCGQDGQHDHKWGIKFINGVSAMNTNNQVIGMQFCHDNVGGTDSSMRPVYVGRETTYTIINSSVIQDCADRSFIDNKSRTNIIVNEIGP